MHRLIFLDGDKRLGVFTSAANAPRHYTVIDFYDSHLAFGFTARLKSPEELLALYNALGEALDVVCHGLVSPLPDGEENPEVETIKKKASGLVYA